MSSSASTGNVPVAILKGNGGHVGGRGQPTGTSSVAVAGGGMIKMTNDVVPQPGPGVFEAARAQQAKDGRFLKTKKI